MTNKKWIVDFDKNAFKDFLKLDPSIQQRIKNFIDERLLTLSDPRRVGKQLSGTLSHLWRYRIGDYRILCTFKDHQMIVLVVEVGHRKEVYD